MLRFYALWEDADSLYGKTRPVTIQYFLVDDTVEVRVVHEPNSGRDPFSVLMRRLKLPKNIKSGSGEKHFNALKCSLSGFIMQLSGAYTVTVGNLTHYTIHPSSGSCCLVLIRVMGVAGAYTSGHWTKEGNTTWTDSLYHD